MKYIRHKTRVDRENVIVSKDIHPSGKVAYDSKGYMVDRETRKAIEIDEAMAKQLEAIGFAIEPVTDESGLGSGSRKPVTKMNLEELKNYAVETHCPLPEGIETKAEYIKAITTHLAGTEE